MIYILDDTVSQRKNEIQYLQNTSYSEVCTLIERSTKKIFRVILDSFSEKQNGLLCIHRSLKYFNDSGAEITEQGDNTIDNFIKEVRQMNIACIVFGRDMSRNREKLTIDKNVFYRNLKLFLDTMIAGNMVLDILYDGALYKIAERKRLLNEIINIINFECPPYDTPLLFDLLSRYFGEDPKAILELWTNKGYSKKEIRQYINDNL